MIANDFVNLRVGSERQEQLVEFAEWAYRNAQDINDAGIQLATEILVLIAKGCLVLETGFEELTHEELMIKLKECGL